MTAIHFEAPAQRTGGRHHLPSASAAVEVGEVLRAVESLAHDSSRPCEGEQGCGRVGALTLVAEERTTSLCGLHAMAVVFSSAGGPVVVVRAGD